METLSRVKRYEDLRKQIEDDSIGTDTLPEEKLQDYAQRLNELDPSIFKKVTISEEEPYTPERERKVFEDDDQTVGEFRNEYLDDFINEVREYNIKKGNRESENTQIDILNRLNAVSRAKRSDYVQNIEEEVSEPQEGKTLSLNRDEIAAQVKSMAAEDFSYPEQEEKSKPDMVLQRESVDHTKEQPVHKETVQDMTELKKTAEETIHTQKLKKQKASAQKELPEAEKQHPLPIRKNKPVTIEEHRELEREKKLHQKLVEETQQLRVQLNEYEDDLNDLSEGVEKTNKMLNVILGCLILALLVIIGIVIYWIVQAGGLV